MCRLARDQRWDQCHQRSSERINASGWCEHLIFSLNVCGRSKVSFRSPGGDLCYHPSSPPSTSRKTQMFWDLLFLLSTSLWTTVSPNPWFQTWWVNKNHLLLLNLNISFSSCSCSLESSWRGYLVLIWEINDEMFFVAHTQQTHNWLQGLSSCAPKDPLLLQVSAFKHLIWMKWKRALEAAPRTFE